MCFSQSLLSIPAEETGSQTFYRVGCRNVPAGGRGQAEPGSSVRAGGGGCCEQLLLWSRFRLRRYGWTGLLAVLGSDSLDGTGGTGVFVFHFYFEC